jgi:hypothetical protein
MPLRMVADMLAQRRGQVRGERLGEIAIVRREQPDHDAGESTMTATPQPIVSRRGAGRLRAPQPVRPDRKARPGDHVLDSERDRHGVGLRVEAEGVDPEFEAPTRADVKGGAGPFPARAEP